MGQTLLETDVSQTDTALPWFFLVNGQCLTDEKYLSVKGMFS